MEGTPDHPPGLEGAPPRRALDELAPRLEEHRRTLWGICYRMTGVAADADDLVQETLARAVVARPDRSGEPLRPWLTQVAVRLAVDVLRRRRRAAYPGSWLPGPAPSEPEDLTPSSEARYGVAESVSYAFLVALEALTPLQRAVLLLRDVNGSSVKEVARLLETSEGAAKLAHLRARRAMAAYERGRLPRRPASGARTRAALQAFLEAIRSGDPVRVERLLAAEVLAVTDGGGRYRASARPLVGAAEVARFFTKVTAAGGGAARIGWAELNGLPALVIEPERPVAPGPGRPGIPPRLVIRGDLDAAGRLAHLHVIAADRKLSKVPAAASDRRMG
jgi:RNA polymerase sigma-70 factor (ECF subfamily)